MNGKITIQEMADNLEGEEVQVPITFRIVLKEATIFPLVAVMVDTITETIKTTMAMLVVIAIMTVN